MHELSLEAVSVISSRKERTFDSDPNPAAWSSVPASVRLLAKGIAPTLPEIDLFLNTIGSSVVNIAKLYTAYENTGGGGGGVVDVVGAFFKVQYFSASTFAVSQVAKFSSGSSSVVPVKLVTVGLNNG